MRMICDFMTGYFSCPTPGNIWHHWRECSRITAHAVLILIILLIFAFLFWKILIIVIWFMDLCFFFFSFFLDFLPEVLLNPCKEGNPFNYCQDLVVRCNIPFLSGVSSSCMAAHRDSAPTLASAKPAVCQWPHPSVSLHFKGYQCTRWHPWGCSAREFHHSCLSRSTRSIKEIPLNTIGQIDKMTLGSVKVRLK